MGEAIAVLDVPPRNTLWNHGNLEGDSQSIDTYEGKQGILHAMVYCMPWYIACHGIRVAGKLQFT